MIRDEQRASKVELTREVTELLDHTSAKNHSRPRLKIKTFHLRFSHKKAQKAQMIDDALFVLLVLYVAQFLAVAGLPAAASDNAYS